MSVTTDPTEDSHPGELKTLFVNAHPPDGGSIREEIEAARDVKIKGWSVGDTVSTGKGLHQWMVAELGSFSYGELSGGSNDVDMIDDGGVLFEFDMTQLADTASGTGLADNDGLQMFFPGEYHVPWNEGQTLNIYAQESSGATGSTAMDVTFYYVPADGDDGSVVL